MSGHLASGHAKCAKDCQFQEYMEGLKDEEDNNAEGTENDAVKIYDDNDAEADQTVCSRIKSVYINL